MRLAAILLFPLLISACTVTTTQTAPPSTPAPQQEAPQKREAPQQITQADARRLARNFTSVVRRIEPVAERECRARTPQQDCDFKIVVDDRPNQPPNAYQTVDNTGRPILAMTVALIADARNTDELAFVLGHEAAHHIAEHLGRQRQNATAGALVFGSLAQITGGGSSAVETATRIGATVGARSYSKEFELEADALGTVIAHKAGYDPVRGAEFFNRIPDPGNRFLGTHPPNADRIKTVRRVAATLK
ncbi:M48 family metalloprotease [Cognatishimia sp. MH4019]|uniref:M48 family metalloprotease n=1 Tax=Cognatishimia sp. MH4019 TaxID=2854030 RepID=UPI001CD41943|nr:M48 family metalloprotease [Cognatishimia sp. MH4019]